MALTASSGERGAEESFALSHFDHEVIPVQFVDASGSVNAPALPQRPTSKGRTKEPPPVITEAGSM